MAIYQGHNEDSSGNLLLSIGNGMTATVETGTKASQAYVKGAYLFFNNKLCKASSAIAKNATLTIGTNLTQTSLGAELTSHLKANNGNEFYFDIKDNKYGFYPNATKTASEFVPFGGSASTLTFIAFNPSNETFTAEINALYLVNIFNNTNTNLITFTGADILSLAYTSTSYGQGEFLIKATATTVSWTYSAFDGGNTFVVKIS